ncbi:MAG: type II secretion system F family protein [Pirellulales bacterium]
MISVPAFAGMLILGAALLFTLHLMYGPADVEARDEIHLALNLAGWTMVYLGLFICLIAILGAVGLLLWFLLPVVALMVYAQRRAMQRRILLSMLAIATERSLPLETALAAFAQEQPTRPRRWANRLASRLAAGESLPDAIVGCRDCLPEFAEVYARVGQDVGAMGPALREAASRQSWGRSLWHSMAGRVFYILAFVLIAQVIGIFCLVSLAPTYQQIFNEFGMALPPVTTTVLDVGDVMARGWWIVVSSVSLGLLGIGGMLLLFEMGFIRSLPLVDRLFRPAHTAVILRNLALAAERKQPIVTSLKSMAAVYPRSHIRHRLQHIAYETASGGDWCESLRSQRLIGRSDAAVLQSAQRVGNLAWALRETADRGFRRVAYQIQTFVQLAFPCIILCFGILVLWFVVGMFVPLVTMIQGLT